MQIQIFSKAHNFDFNANMFTGMFSEFVYVKLFGVFSVFSLVYFSAF